jgi:hypothetical protein
MVLIVKTINKYLKIICCLFVVTGCSNAHKGELHFVEPSKTDKFNFPYYLFVPHNVNKDNMTFIVVEPNNTGFADDDLQKHSAKAERMATKDFYIGRYVAGELNFPLLVPVFPRSKTNWEVYTHALDRDAMLQAGNKLERIDLQLIAMFDDARALLKTKGIVTNEKILLTGFSASGTFANRFTLLHPEKVFAVAAGGLNGLLMLPEDSLNGNDLNYPLGINDFEVVTGNEFQIDLFKDVPQLYFMGELDDNDAVPYSDAYSQDERETIYDLIGSDEMLPKRWDFCKTVYQQNDINAQIKVFKGIGHEQPDEVKKGVVNFFERELTRGGIEHN